jgi:hypothetical protein
MNDRTPIDVATRDEEPSVTFRPRRGPGRREQRRRKEKKLRRRRTSLYVFLGWILAAALIAGALFLLQREVSRRVAGGPGEQAPPAQETWLLIGTDESDTSGAASWLAVMSWSPEGKGLYLYLPPTTYIELPGFGLEVVGKARSLGGEPLTLSAVSNLLGVSFDHHLRISDQSSRALFDAVGGIDLDVSSRLTEEDPDGRIRTVFAEGPQHLDGERVAEYLSYVDAEVDELTRALRHAAVWAALFTAYADDPEALGDVFESSAELFPGEFDPEELQEFFTAMASAGDEGLTFETLPVDPVGVDAESQFYAPEREAIERLVARHLSGSRPAGAGQTGRRVQILNGNGVPGIGQQVAADLVPEGFRVVLNANANRFNYAATQIVVYSDSEEALKVGAEVRGILGVGETVVSLQKQSLVDVTIVVGRDYLER